jgi:hypothetical protein
MADPGWFFLYTPIPWLAGMCFTAYRHDLTRLVRPFRDHARLSDWRSVCGRLSLTKPGTVTSNNGRRFSRRLLVLYGSVQISLLWALVPDPMAWYDLIVLQVTAAFPLFVSIRMTWAGPFPHRPYRDVLPYPRLGTRIRHLGVEKEESKPDSGGRSDPETKSDGPRGGT